MTKASTNHIAEVAGTFGCAVGKGLIAGAAGTATMSISQLIDMKLSGREPSSTPAKAAEKVLHVKPEKEEEENLLSREVHWAYGTSWGVLRGLLSAAGLKGWPATFAHFAAVWGSSLILLPRLGLSSPITKWKAPSINRDVLQHVVYAIAAGLIYHAIDKNDRHKKINS